MAEVMAIGDGPPVSDIPLPFEQVQELAKAVQAKTFQRKQYPVRNGTVIADGPRLMKEVLLQHGYELSRDRRGLISTEYRNIPDVALNKYGIIEEIDLNRVAPRAMNALYMILVAPTKQRRRENAAKASRAAQKKRAQKKLVETEQALEQVRQQRRALRSSRSRSRSHSRSRSRSGSPSRSPSRSRSRRRLPGPVYDDGDTEIIDANEWGLQSDGDDDVRRTSGF